MHDHRHYVPILKGKRGEFGALAVLSATTRGRLTPLIEPTPIEIDPTTDQPKRTNDQHIENIIDGLTKAHADQSKTFVDLRFIASDGPLMNAFVTASKAAKLAVVPVWTPGDNDALHSAVRMSVGKHGACLRLEGDVLDPDSIATSVETALKDLQLRAAHVDLILDFHEVASSRMGRDVRAARDLINALPNVREWRTLTWAGTAFPKSLSEFHGNTVGTIERTEWKLWLELLKQTLARVPAFGDYAIAHPDLTAFDPKKMKLSASVRYTGRESWVIWKGRSLKDHGGEQFNAISKLIVAHDEFTDGISWGDKFAQRCALGGPPGNHEQWRKAGTSHHLELVTRQLATLPGLSAVA